MNPVQKMVLIDEISRRLQDLFSFGGIDTFLADYGLRYPPETSLNDLVDEDKSSIPASGEANRPQSKRIYTRIALLKAPTEKILSMAQHLEIDLPPLAADVEINPGARDLITENPPTPNDAAIAKPIFIGHGQSPVWHELRDFLTNCLHLPVEEFNGVSTAGIATISRLSAMLDSAAFAFLIMTAEDEQPDGRLRARLNVIHEVGLFQGRLGFDRAIVVLEDGCEEFSNIHGLGQIRFPKSNVSACFDDVRRVLQRERLIH